MWTVTLDEPGLPPHRLTQTLAADEQMRARRFHFMRDRNRFVVCRAMLRKILAHYLDTKPAQIQFCYGAHGKPVLAPAFRDREIHFNVSHSNGMALLAFTCQQELGVDIECMRPLPDVEQIVERHFSCRERAAFQLLPAPQRLATFFRWWTCKEAFLKALGQGLAYPLDHIDVSMVTDQPATLVSTSGDGQAIGWSVQSFSAVPGYTAALVVAEVE